MFTRKRGLLFLFSKLIRLNLNARPARQLAHRAPVHGNYPRASARQLSAAQAGPARDVMQLHCVPRPTWTEPSGRELLPPAGPEPHVQAAMTSLAHKKKNKPRDPRDSPREHMRSTVHNLHRAFC